MIQASTPPPSKFLVLWTLVRYTKVRQKSEISCPGKLRNPTFFIVPNLALVPKNDSRNAEMGTTLLPDSIFWEFFPNNPRNWTGKL